MLRLHLPSTGVGTTRTKVRIGQEPAQLTSVATPTSELNRAWRCAKKLVAGARCGLTSSAACRPLLLSLLDELGDTRNRFADRLAGLPEAFEALKHAAIDPDLDLAVLCVGRISGSS